MSFFCSVFGKEFIEGITACITRNFAENNNELLFSYLYNTTMLQPENA